MAVKKRPKLTYEQGVSELEAIVARLSEGKLSLEDSMKTYEEGVALAGELSRLLEQHERRVEQLDPETGEISPLEGE